MSIVASMFFFAAAQSAPADAVTPNRSELAPS